MCKNKSVFCFLVGFALLSAGSLSFAMANHEIFDVIEKGDANRVQEIVLKETISGDKDYINTTTFSSSTSRCYDDFGTLFDDDFSGSTLLCYACYTKNLNVVKVLFGLGCKDSINKANAEGKTPLYMACCYNPDLDRYYMGYGLKIDDDSLEIARLLLNNGAKDSINKADIYGNTPLSAACHNNKPEIVKLLLECGAKGSVNVAKKDGETPLCSACDWNNIEIVKLLLEYGANIDRKSFEEVQKNLRDPKKQTNAMQILTMFRLKHREEKMVEGLSVGLEQRKRNRDALERGDEGKDDELPGHKKDKN